MNKENRLQKAYNYLRLNNDVQNQTDVAEAMGATRPNVSAALNGNKKILTNSFLRRFNAAFGNIFNIDWLIDGVGEMLCPEAQQEMKGIEIKATQTIEAPVGGDVTQTIGNAAQAIPSQTNAVMTKEIELLRQQLKEKNEEIQFLRSIIANQQK